ncbi:MAG: hypothetical protein AAF385_16620 [Pseudomonadota bacterium]
MTSVIRRGDKTVASEKVHKIDADSLAQLQVELSSASLELADRLIHSAFREMEAAMFEQVSNRLRGELPDLLANILREHFNGGKTDGKS